MSLVLLRLNGAGARSGWDKVPEMRPVSAKQFFAFHTPSCPSDKKYPSLCSVNSDFTLSTTSGQTGSYCSVERLFETSKKVNPIKTSVMTAAMVELTLITGNCSYLSI